mmetsp:Transcript_18103/g.36481  ORF Transcript_18103/g.36481 Transcript_18103/m.36481 type:complete len:258 (+) Transcript_18103:860-1633(+)
MPSPTYVPLPALTPHRKLFARLSEATVFRLASTSQSSARPSNMEALLVKLLLPRCSFVGSGVWLTSSSAAIMRVELAPRRLLLRSMMAVGVAPEIFLTGMGVPASRATSSRELRSGTVEADAMSTASGLPSAPSLSRPRLSLLSPLRRSSFLILIRCREVLAARAVVSCSICRSVRVNSEIHSLMALRLSALIGTPAPICSCCERYSHRPIRWSRATSHAPIHALRKLTIERLREISRVMIGISVRVPADSGAVCSR